MSESNDFIYFVVFADKECETLTVIDLQRCVDYEREDWNCIDNMNFQSHTDACEYARAVAKANNLKYRPFESRYNSMLNEPKIQLVFPNLPTS